MMRRGHPGNVRWRNENQKHFRPRSGGAPHYRPFRVFSLLETPVFPPPGLRPPRGIHPYGTGGTEAFKRSENDIRKNFRFNRGSGKPQRPQFQQQSNRHYAANTPQIRHKNPDHNNHYYHENKNRSEQCHINSMGDIDDRQAPFAYKQQPADWFQIESQDYCNFDDQNFFNKPNNSHSSYELNKVFEPNYRDHRPPSSDHYGSNSIVAADNSNTFSRSVNDTVNIVRERLLNRNEVQHQPSALSKDNNLNDNKNLQEPNTSNYQNVIQEQPNKKRMQRQKQNIKSDCDKIKNKIVHQLFKMDKEKIHKLMDNPSSSTKFEYAISSLITESQNSLNRHVRSVAEKSLCDSSTEFIADDNTIYEDTFMKQMQCILDPQDTVLLEDIKPIVMEELRKVLQLSDFDQRFEKFDYLDQPRTNNFNSENSSRDISNEVYVPDKNAEGGLNSCIEDGFSLQKETVQKQQIQISQDVHQNFENNAKNHFENNQMFERGSYRKNLDPVIQQKIEIRHEHRRSMDKQFNETIGMQEVVETPSIGSYNRSIDNSLKEIKPECQEGTQRSVRNSWQRSSIDKSLNELGLESQELKQRQNMNRIQRWSTDKSFNNLQPVTQDTAEILETDSWHRKSIDKPLNNAKQESQEILWSANVDNFHKPERGLYIEEQPNASETTFASCSSSFIANLEQISDDDDPFAELDKQYHVDVDPNFIADDDDMMFNSKINVNIPNPDNEKDHSKLLLNTDTPTDLKKTHNSRIPCKAKSPLQSPNKKILCGNDYDSSEKLNNFDSSNIRSNEELVNLEHEEASEATNINGQKIKTESEVRSPISSKSYKRSIEQKPLHRKEKRKKSDSSQADKNISNKKLVINLTDCVTQTSEQCDSAKSQFNPSFYKDENKKQELQETKKVAEIIGKDYSDKHTKHKKKEYPKKPKPKKKRAVNKKSHFVPRDVSVTTTLKQMSPKESKNKLTNIDMFVDQTRTSYKANRNLIDNMDTKTKCEEKKLYKSVTTSKIKLIKRHVATQVVRKLHSREIQTSLNKNIVSRHCQTETKKLFSKSVQTDSLSLEISTRKSSDTLERMKEIDLEIQLLLQEKFKLYNSFESKQHQESNVLPTLGMTVVNVSKEIEINEDSLSEDAIVEDFTNIPVEELEQIAFEAVDNEENETVTIKKTKRRQNITQNDRKKSESPINITKKSNRKAKTPNISLIEQIITDERPLEEIILLDDLEDIPVSIRKRQNTETLHGNVEDVIHQSKTKINKKVPKKRFSKKVNKPKNTSEQIEYNIKPCSVILLKQDLSKYINTNCDEPSNFSQMIVLDEATEIAEETIVNDFDMLDVSEDIIIGESCEVKLLEDKDERLDVPLSEEIILDNSQSSSDDIVASNLQSNENQCRMYDYSADESLRRDSIAVSGNGDAVLAIESIENNFLAACLDGNVYYFNGDGQLITTLRGSNLAVTCLTIVKEKYGTTVYTGSLDSRIRYFDLETGLEKGSECNVLSPIQTMDRAWDTIFVGTRTGFVLQFECKNNMLIPVSTVKFSEQSILALRAMKEGPRKVLLVAARSENVTIKDAQTGLLLRTLEGPKMTVYTLLYEDSKVYCGTSSHQIHVFDYTSGCHVGTHEGGKGAVCLRAVGGLLFAGCYDGCVYVYRDGEARPFAQLRGPGLMLLSLAVKDTKIIAGYKDRSLHIWKIPLTILQEMIL